MWRGFFVSCRYSVSCWSERLRPNHVFHQNRNGMRQISQAVTKKRSFWVRDMPGFLGVCPGVPASISSPVRLLDMLARAIGADDIERPPYDGILINEPKGWPTAV